MSKRSILVVAPGRETEEAPPKEHRRRAETRAVGMFNREDNLSRYFYGAHRDTSAAEPCATPLSSDVGKERLNVMLDRAQRRRRRHFEAVQETVEDDGIEAALTSHDMSYHFRGLGSWTSDACLVYDGTSYSYGRPLYDGDDLEYIKENIDAPLYTVKIVGEY